jgi:L-iditol 2-dehydrogenase
MRAAILYGAHDFRLEELPDPQIAAEQCLISVKACGVCHSELHQWDEKLSTLDYPRFIGHEVAGIVKQCGENVKKFKEGDAVAVWVDGKGYAEEIAVNQERVFSLNPQIPFAQAMAEPIACTMNAIERTNIQLGDSVAVIGSGFMGLLLLQKIRLAGAGKIIAVDLRDSLLNLAKKFGADIIINPAREDPVQRIKEITGGNGVDVSFEVGGVQATIDTAAAVCRMEGKLVIFGFHPGQRVIRDLGFWNWMAFDIINAHFRDLQQILHGTEKGMQLLNNGQLKMESLITHTYRLPEINQAFATAKQKPEGFVKAVIVFDKD